MLFFAVFTFFAGLSSPEVGVRRIGLILGTSTGLVGVAVVAVAVRADRRVRGRLRLGGAILAGALFSLDDLASRMGCSSAPASRRLDAARREGWLSFMGQGSVYATAPT